MADRISLPSNTMDMMVRMRAALAQGIWAEEIATRLYRSAESEESLFSRQDVYDYCMSLPDVDPEKMRAVSAKITDESWLPSHSAAYRAAYRPAYRVLLKAFLSA